MSSVAVQPKIDAYGHVKIPLTAERKQQIAEEMAEGIVGLLRDDLMARAQEGMARGHALAAQAAAKKERAEELHRLAEQKKAEAEQHVIKAAQHGARADQLRAQQQQIIKIVSSGLLLGVFHGHKKLPAPLVEEVFAKYLANLDAIAILQDPETKKAYYEAKTTIPFAQYIEANPGVTTCDFRIFNEKIFDNMEHVARALSDPSCSVSAVWINSKISDEAKAYLEKAERNRGEAIRNGETTVPLTINFV